MCKVQFLFFKIFLIVLKKNSFWEEDWALGYNSTKFWDLPDIFLFLKVLSLKSFFNSWDNWNIQCLLLVNALFHVMKEKIGQTSKSLNYDHDCRLCLVIVDLS